MYTVAHNPHSCILRSRRRYSNRNWSWREWRKSGMSWDWTQIDWKAGWVSLPVTMHAGRMLLKIGGVTHFQLTIALVCLWVCYGPDCRIVGRTGWWERHEWISIPTARDWNIRETPAGERPEGFTGTCITFHKGENSNIFKTLHFWQALDV